MIAQLHSNLIESGPSSADVDEFVGVGRCLSGSWFVVANEDRPQDTLVFRIYCNVRGVTRLRKVISRGFAVARVAQVHG